jgi:hypothetical protein
VEKLMFLRSATNCLLFSVDLTTNCILSLSECTFRQSEGLCAFLLTSLSLSGASMSFQDQTTIWARQQSTAGNAQVLGCLWRGQAVPAALGCRSLSLSLRRGLSFLDQTACLGSTAKPSGE